MVGPGHTWWFLTQVCERQLTRSLCWKPETVAADVAAAAATPRGAWQGLVAVGGAPSRPHHCLSSTQELVTEQQREGEDARISSSSLPKTIRGHNKYE
ncbi:hypothetical protein E2C01_082189 [Portunus trituberculatus]|uniref:Uncharacterized protein n=1 Tax=Portunus trituberculatus TaxID=210409 RepID=A0A5B7IYF3_PORTR|nr:hypothetical protein [Portunus trituberculatus]